MKDCLFNGIKNLDMHSNGLKINLNKNETQFHFIGLLFTIGVLAITILSKINLIKDYLNNSNPTLKQYNREINSDEYSNFTFSDIVFILYKVDFINSKIIPIKQEEIEVLTIINQSFNLGNINYEYVGGLFRCSEKDLNDSGIKKEKFSSDYYNSLFSEYSLCIKSASNTKSFSFNNNKNLAITLHNINTDADLIFTEIYIKESELVYNNYENPVITKWNLKSFYTTKGNTMHNIILKKNTYSFNNLSFIFESLRDTTSYYNIDNISEGFFINTDKKNTTIHIRIFQSLINSMIDVRYVTIDEIVSSIGGSFSVIFFIFHCIYSYFFDFLSKVDIVNSIFSYENDQHISKKAKEIDLTFTKSLKDSSKEIENNIVLNKQKINNSDSLVLKDSKDTEHFYSKNVFNTDVNDKKSSYYNKKLKIKNDISEEFQINSKIEEKNKNDISYFEGFIFTFCTFCCCLNSKSKNTKALFYKECIEATLESLNIFQILNLFKEVNFIKKALFSLASDNYNLIYHTFNNEKKSSKYKIKNPKEVKKEFNFKNYINDSNSDNDCNDKVDKMNKMDKIELNSNNKSYIVNKLLKTEEFNCKNRYNSSSKGNKDICRFKKFIRNSLLKEMNH